MNLLRIIAANELRILWRNRFQVWVLSLFVLLGCYSVYYGHTEISRQSARISQVADSICKAQMQYLDFIQADTATAAGKKEYEQAAYPSLTRFRYNFVAANKPLPVAALTLGQRDLYPYYFVLNAQHLYTQTLKGEIYNPFKLSAGNFDLAFVMIYLMPLLIIGLCFDVFSFEKDTGTFTLLRISNYPFRSILINRLLFRYLLVSAITLLLSFTGFAVTGMHFPHSIQVLLLWMAVLSVYNALWFAVLLFINSFGKSTSFNATAAISAWILALIVIPCLLNLAGQHNRQTSAISFATLMRSRSMPETDDAMKEALQAFYAYYPRLKPQDMSTKNPYFKYQGYSAFLAVDQLKSAAQIEAFYRQVSISAARSERLNFINPAVNTQEMLNGLAATGMEAVFDFKAAVKQFHHAIFWFSNKPLFENRMMRAEDYARSPVFHFQPQTAAGTRLLAGMLQLVLLALLLAMWGCRNLSDKKLTRI